MLPATAIQPAEPRTAPANARRPNPPARAELEALPFRLHVWDETRSHVETLLAATSNGSVGYAMLFSAAKQFPRRYLTLTRNGTIVFGCDGGPGP
jgi:hypothetical protein